MELQNILNFPSSNNEVFFKRASCPSCYSDSKKAQLSIFSSPSAENISIDNHGNFLSGYSDKRIFFSYYRCNSCELLYCPTYFSQAQLDFLYKSQSENMAEAPLKARKFTQKYYYNLIKKYPILAGDYLEIGADIGLFANLISYETNISNMFLYEPNHTVHDTLKVNVQTKRYQIQTKNFEADDINQDSLTLAVIIHALDHMLEPRKLLQDIYKNLKPGGLVFIVTHDESSFLSRILKKKWPPYTLQHPQLFKPSTIRNLLQYEGFAVLSCNKTANYFPLTYFIKAGLTALGFKSSFIPSFSNPLIPIKLGNIATIAQKPYVNSK